MKKTLTGPGGIRIELDTAEIFPDDPGQGTPAMVHLLNADATYGCAANEGELTDPRGRAVELSASQLNWLHAQEGEVWNFLEAHGG